MPRLHIRSNGFAETIFSGLFGFGVRRFSVTLFIPKDV
jgi:hypothetical protein